MDYGRRQKVEERTLFTEEERDRIAAKSGHKCARCGKPVYFGYGGTVDHYVPIALGGTNDMRNLFLMCKDCNEDKTDRVLEVESAVPYADAEAKRQAKEYFNEYVEKFEYVDNHNMLKYDEYDVEAGSHVGRGSHRVAVPARRLTLKRMVPKDLPALTEYFWDYLKRNGVSGSRELCRMDMEFWLKVGAVYSVSDREGMKVVIAATPCIDDGWDDDDAGDDADDADESGQDVPEEEITLSVFTYYSSYFWIQASLLFIESFAGHIVKERGLERLHVKIRVPAADQLAGPVLTTFSSAPHMDRGNHCFGVAYTTFTTEEDSSRDAYEYAEAEKEFFGLFRGMDFLAQKLILKFHEECPDIDIEDYDWLLCDVRHTLGEEFEGRHPELYDKDEEGKDSAL